MKKRTYLEERRSFSGLYTSTFDPPVTLFPSAIGVAEFSLDKSFGHIADAFCKVGGSIAKALKDAERLYGKR